MSDYPAPEDQLHVVGEDPPAETEGRPSRRSLWLAMGAVAVALGLIWLAPGIGEHQDEDAAGGAIAEYPGEPDDAQAAG